jgi:hypothetical protein
VPNGLIGIFLSHRICLVAKPPRRGRCQPTINGVSTLHTWNSSAAPFHYPHQLTKHLNSPAGSIRQQHPFVIQMNEPTASHHEQHRFIPDIISSMASFSYHSNSLATLCH